MLSLVQLSVIPWAVALKAPLSMGFSTQEHWSGLPRPPPGDLPNPGIEPGSPALQADSLPSEPPKQGDGYNSVHSSDIFMGFEHCDRDIFREGSCILPQARIPFIIFSTL